MCESNAYILKDGKHQLLMESVGLIRSDSGKVFLKSIFGETLSVDGRVVEMDLTGHKILLKNP